MNEIYKDAEAIQDFVKTEYAANRISEQTANELLRMIEEMKLKTIFL